MTDRKFTPPTEFPAEYVDGHGRKVTILGRSNLKEQPLVCFDEAGYVYNYTEDGGFLSIAPSESFDLHDKPKRITLQEVTAELEQAEARIEELEAKLAKAVEDLERIGSGEFSGQMLTSMPPQDAAAYFARATIAELQGETGG